MRCAGAGLVSQCSNSSSSGLPLLQQALPWGCNVLVSHIKSHTSSFTAKCTQVGLDPACDSPASLALVLSSYIHVVLMTAGDCRRTCNSNMNNISIRSLLAEAAPSAFSQQHSRRPQVGRWLLPARCSNYRNHTAYCPRYGSRCSSSSRWSTSRSSCNSLLGSRPGILC